MKYGPRSRRGNAGRIAVVHRFAVTAASASTRAGTECGVRRAQKTGHNTRFLQCGQRVACIAATFAAPDLNLLRTLSTVSGMTLLSRITGLLRETIKATAFGAGIQMDAFEAAFRLPNLLRRLFAEGAFSQAFVPILAEYRRRRGLDATRQLVGNVGTLLAVVLLALSVLGSLAAPWLVYLLAGGFARTPGKVELTAEMIRIVFPYILFVSLVSLAGGVLNVFRRFAIPAFTPVLLNVSIIGAAIFLARLVDPPIVALAWGVAIGGLAQLLLQIRPLLAIGMLPRPAFGWRDEGVRRVLAAMGPAVIGVSAAQISALINTQLAALLGDGRISWITYADRLMEFPSALLGVALGTILLPSLAQHYSDADHEQYSALLDWGLRLAMLLAAPAAVALAILALPLVSTLYQYGRFTVDDVLQTRLQHRTAGTDSREDPRPRVLRAAGDGHAGEDRVRDGSDHADARRAVRVAAWARAGGPDARNQRRSDVQCDAFAVAVAAQRLLPPATRLVALPRENRRRRCAPRRRDRARDGTRHHVALGGCHLQGRAARARRCGGRPRVFRRALRAGIQARRLQPARGRGAGRPHAAGRRRLIPVSSDLRSCGTGTSASCNRRTGRARAR
jgi:hypothetical protein